MVDSQRMAQVVDNLISNAVKYTQTGSIHVSLAVEDRVQIEVTDTGIGIDSMDRDHLFTRFYRARHAQDQSIQGVGLGLSIIKSIVESHGGRIEVDSEVGRGSRFQVRLPLDLLRPDVPRGQEQRAQSSDSLISTISSSASPSSIDRRSSVLAVGGAFSTARASKSVPPAIGASRTSVMSSSMLT